MFSEDEFETYSWDSLLLEPINAGCLAFIVQTDDVAFMMRSFDRLFHTPKSVYRANRKYLYIPTKMTSDEHFEQIVKESFSIREMDYMPNIVLAKLEVEKNDHTVGNSTSGFISHR